VNDPSLLVRFIEISVGLSSLTVVLLFVALVIIRVSNGLARNRREPLDARWRAVFGTAYDGEPAPEALPAIGGRDWFYVLRLFGQFCEIRESDRERAPAVVARLDALARRLGLDAYALDLLEKRVGAERITALNVLGDLGDARAFQVAAALATDDGPEVSRAAAHAALRIDPEFVDRFLELVRERDDWARPRVEAMLREVDARRLDRAMQKAIAVEGEAGRTRLLDYVRFCTLATARTICREIVSRTTDAQTVAAALRSLAPLAGEDDREIALTYCDSPESVVALGGLRVLRKCVRPEDEPLLRELTAHSDYWFRLRAAEVVVQLYGSAAATEAFAEHHPDRYARDAVRQALAERTRMDARRAGDERRGLETAGARR
jgi:hypothetical protein